MLSILLPSYNNECLMLVAELQQQASAVDGLEYEIIVADDGGNDLEVKKRNFAINDMPHCRYIIRESNVGRAAIRNFLAQQAKGDWLLFIDSDVSPGSADFLDLYAKAMHEGNADVVCGGVRMINDERFSHLLRYRYEHAEEKNHTAEARAEHPYDAFRTTNFMVRSSVMSVIHFDERFTGYGYEDVMFGIHIAEAGKTIRHIDNPILYTHFEENALFIRKIEEAMRTLHLFRTDLDGYSQILSVAATLRRYHLTGFMKMFHWFFYPILKLNLIGRHPSLLAFKLYKLGYYVSL